VVQVSVPISFNPGKTLPPQGSEHQEAREHDSNASADTNAATAPGKVCGLCGALIKANQEARRRVDGEWIHEECPIQ
jgi:hypothetical protein